MLRRGLVARWILRSLIALLLFIIVFAAFFAAYLRRHYSPEKIKTELETALKERTGYAVSIAELEFTLAGDIKLKKICVRNPEMLTARCFIAADIASLDLAILPLLKKSVEIRGIDIAWARLAFFTERQMGAGKPRELKSWEAKKTTIGTGTNLASGRFMVRKVRVSSGELEHEAPVLPLPNGITKFRMSVEEGDNQKITVGMVLPDRGTVDLELGGRARNLVETLRLFITATKFDDADRFSGKIVLNRFNAGKLDARLNTVAGEFAVEVAKNGAAMETKAAQVSLLKPIAQTLTLTGHFTVLLPQLSIQASTGIVTGFGFDARFAQLWYDAKAGASGKVTANVDLSKFRDGVQGRLFLTGTLAASQFSGTFTVKDFLAASGDLRLEAPQLAGEVTGDTVRLKRQNLVLNQNPLVGDFVISRRNAHTEISANIDSLKIRAWEIEALSLKLNLAPEKIRVENGAGRVARGNLRFTYGKNLASGTQDVQLTLSGAKAQDLSRILELKARVFGDVTLDANLVATGSLAERRNLTGPVNIRIGRGKIKDSFFQQGILAGPLHKLEEKLSDIEFAAAWAEIRFNQGNLSIKKLFFDAEEWSVSVRAEADKDWGGKAALDFRFRESFVSNVANPLHLGIESRREGEFYDLPFACRGNILSGACYQKNW